LRFDSIQAIQADFPNMLLEPTFNPVHPHLGVETQRQWPDQAVVRTTPVLLGLF